MNTPLSLPPHRHGEDAPFCDVSAAGRVADTHADARHIVIVGAGFGGLTLAKALKRVHVRITLIDRRNHHLFQPLLYQVATAALSPADIAAPIRGILSGQENATVLLGNVTGVDTDKKEIVLGEQRIAYDMLVLATGARHSYFGHDEWEAAAPGLKSLEDATNIRRRILLAFEQAEIECNMRERERLLTFIIIGGGPTGVEMAGAIAEIARHALSNDFRNIDPASARVILIEAGARLLPSFPEALSDSARRQLERIGVEVRLGKPVTACDADGVTIDGQRVEARTVVWGAGVQASPAAAWIGAPTDRAGRIIVAADLAVPGRPDIFAIGDTAHAEDDKGMPYPGVAPVAKQQGMFLAQLIKARIAGKPGPQRFHYKNFGNLATIGRTAAVCDFGALRLTGFPAWLLWSVAHIYFLIGFKNRIAVAWSWLWAYLTFERGARLITGELPEPQTQSAKAAPPPPIAIKRAAGQ